MNDEWGPWIKHYSTGCPLVIGQVFEAYAVDFEFVLYYARETQVTDEVKKDWDTLDKRVRDAGLGGLLGITYYRVKKDKRTEKGMRILRDILEGKNNPMDVNNSEVV